MFKNFMLNTCVFENIFHKAFGIPSQSTKGSIIA